MSAVVNIFKIIIRIIRIRIYLSEHVELSTVAVKCLQQSFIGLHIKLYIMESCNQLNTSFLAKFLETIV